MYTLYEPLLRLPQRASIPYVVTLHDYFTLCPTIQLTDVNGRYCGEPEGGRQCEFCLLQRPHMDWQKYLNVAPLPIRDWRNFWERWLSEASLVIVPHEDVRQRIKRYFPALSIKVMENPELVCPENIKELRQEQYQTRTRQSDRQVLRVGLVGALGCSKGGTRLLTCARLAQEKHLPIEFVLFGILTPDVFEQCGDQVPASLTILGSYKEEDVYQQIVDNSIDYFWFPSFCPETYSYTLSIPIRLGVPVIGSDLGAIGARIRDHGWGETHPWDMESEVVLKRLMSFDYNKVSRENLVVTNTKFPLAEKLYEHVVLKHIYNSLKLPNSRLHELADNLCRREYPHNMDGKELKILLTRRPSKSLLIRYIVALSPGYIYRYIRNHSVMQVGRHIKQVLFSRFLR